MNFFSLLDGHQTLVLSGGDSLMTMDRKSPQQKIARGMDINDVEPGCYFHKHYSQVKVKETKSVCCVTSKT